MNRNNMFGYFRILSSGIFHPEKIISSSEIDELCNLPDGTTNKVHKIIKRHWASEKETTLFMAKKAMDMALNASKIEIHDIDCIINAGCLVPQIIPSTASMLLYEYQATGIDCFDIDCTCISFLKALEIAVYMMASHKYRRVLIFNSELASYGINFQSSEITSIFGDGAVCFILEQSNEHDNNHNVFRLRSSLFQTFPDGGQYSRCKAGGTLTHPKYHDYNSNSFYFEMNGPQLYKIAYKHMPKLFIDLIESAGIKGEEVDYLLPHQASHRAITLLNRALGLPNAKLIDIFSDYGNQVSVSLPHALHVLLNTHDINKSQNIVLLGAAAGVVLGGMIIEKC